jgi:hypothetical protein
MEHRNFLGKPIAYHPAKIQENQHAGIVDSLATSRLTAPTEGRQKMINDRNLNIGHAEKRRDRRGRHGEQLIRKK